MRFNETFSYVIKYKKGKDNIMVDVLSRRYALIATPNARFLGFECIKDLYSNNNDFTNVYEASEKATLGIFYMFDGCLFKENKLCVPNSFVHEFLMCKAHRGGLVGHFGMIKTLEVLYKHFFWPKCDVERVCDRYIMCRQFKSMVVPQWVIYSFFYN